MSDAPDPAQTAEKVRVPRLWCSRHQAIAPVESETCDWAEPWWPDRIPCDLHLLYFDGTTDADL